MKKKISKNGLSAEICDFANSHLTFVLKGVNSARINLDARCRWTDCSTGKYEDFFLICPCQGEKMYVKKGLIQEPPFNFFGVFSKTQSHLIRHHADASVQRDTVENHKGRFDGLKIDLAKFDRATELTSDDAIVEATLRNLPLIARTEIESSDGKSRALMEYPVTTMNVEPVKRIWQVDTGPVLFADFTKKRAQRIEQLVPAFIVYNTRDYAELAVRAPAKLSAGGSPCHYSELRPMAATHRIWSGQPL